MVMIEWSALGRYCLFALLRRAGRIPQHVAFIMDGNRRFAERSHLQRYLGHERGCQKFVEVVKWCLELGVSCVSVYAFSLENFKRSSDEVQELMQLALREFEEYKENGLVDGYEAEVRLIGNMSRVDAKLQSAGAQVMQALDKGTPQPVVNICFAYTSSQEVCRAVDICRTHLEGDVCEDDLWRFCLTDDCPDIDLVIRTSGETRLSDFMNVQCRNAKIVFDRVLWPDYSMWHFVSAILGYSRDYRHLKALDRPVAEIPCEAPGTEANVTEVQERPETCNQEGIAEERVNDPSGRDQVHETSSCLESGSRDTDAPSEKPTVETRPSSNGASEKEQSFTGAFEESRVDKLQCDLRRQKKKWIAKHAKTME